MVYVATAHRLDQPLVVRARMPRERQQLTHDLRVGLAGEAIRGDRSGRPRFVHERALDRPPAGAVCPQQRAINVEQDKFHTTR